MTDNTDNFVDGNHALLCGQLVGLLSRESSSLLISDIEIDTDEQGNYTNEIFLYRPSGTYKIVVEALARNPEMLPDSDGEETEDEPS